MKYLKLFIFAAISINAHADVNTFSYDYIFDFWGTTTEAVPAFALERIIDRDTLGGISVGGFDDVCSDNERLFLVDARESRLHILNKNFELIDSIGQLRTSENNIAFDKRGEQVELTNPEGVFFHAITNQLFIADTGARRILVLDGDYFFLNRIIERPDNMIGVTDFVPSKIVVDRANRIYVVVQAGFEGIIELNGDGSFSRYFGVNSPTVNLLEHFWRVFATNEQRERMARVFAPAFNNVALDANGFVFATSHDANARYMVFRLNPRGENVLIQVRGRPVEGDVSPFVNNQFVAVTVNDYGVYAVLDRVMGRIFVYNFFGELISIINRPPGMRGSFIAPTGITWFGDRLVATDTQLRRAFVYSKTDFGQLAFGAARHFHRGEWAQSANLLEEALRLNANFFLAYSGIGKFHLMQGNYEMARHYLRLGQNRTYYSMAFNYYRSQWIENNFFWFALVFIIVAGFIVYTEIKYHKQGRKNNEAST